MVWKTEVENDFYGSTALAEYGANFYEEARESAVEVVLDNFYLYDLEISGGNEIGVLIPSPSGYCQIAYVTWTYLYNTELYTVVTPTMVGVQQDYRGARNNLAIELYLYTLKKGWTIQAGDISNCQSRGGAAIWAKLFDIDNVDIEAQEFPNATAIFIPDGSVGGYLTCKEISLYESDAILYAFMED